VVGLVSCSSPRPSALVLSHSPRPQYHPSFPTRRSSDLQRRAPARPGCQSDAGRVGTRSHAVGTSLGAGESTGYPAHRQLRICPQDRKSTRLNSSHQIISYAVFCLKKKKTITITKTTIAR